MAEIVGFVAMSHSPFWDGSFEVTGPGQIFAQSAKEIKAKVEEVNPDLVVIFGPDHLRNFFYDLMPAFCIGAGEINSFGDYGSYHGSLPFQKGLGREVVERVRAKGFDPAFSLRMGIDHGIVQPYEVMLPEMDVPVLPIMIDCAAAPRPSFQRSFEFGVAVGDVLREMESELKVLIVASGGLSHWVKAASPYDESIDESTREFLLDGRDTVVEYNAARERGLQERIDAGQEGKINDQWDRFFIDNLTAGNIQELLDMDSEQVEQSAGNGAHEVRAWLAGYGAWANPVTETAYEPVHRWSTGMGLLTAFTQKEVK